MGQNPDSSRERAKVARRLGRRLFSMAEENAQDDELVEVAILWRILIPLALGGVWIVWRVVAS
jgi:hypothetical protein